MTKRKVYIFIFLLTIAQSVCGQQDPQYSQYMYTILPINPGYAGNAGICASLHYRQQWSGWMDTDESTGEKYKTSPRTTLLTVNSPVRALHGGLGLSVYNDAYGHQNDIAVKLAYSFRMNIGGGSLGIGLAGDFLSRQIDKTKYFPGQSGDMVLVNGLGESAMYGDITFGAYFQMQENWYAGISAAKILSAFMNTGGDKVGQSAATHFYALGGYSYTLPADPNWRLLPSAIIKTDFKTPPQLDLTMIAEYNNLIWFGASYRIIDAVAILVGAKPFANFSSAIRGLEIVASYDVNTSKVMRHKRSFGGYEFCLKYCFNIVKPVNVYGYKGTRLLGNKPIDYR